MNKSTKLGSNEPTSIVPLPDGNENEVSCITLSGEDHSNGNEAKTVKDAAKRYLRSKTYQRAKSSQNDRHPQR